MTIRRIGWQELLFAALLAVGLLTAGLPRLPGGGLHLPPLLAVAAGGLAGAALFRALAGARARRPRRDRLGRLAGPRGGLLLGRAVVEEVAWRGFLLGALAGPVGWAPALGATSVAFALAHGSTRGWSRLVHVVTGGVFGALYLASGRLATAAAAHVVYNALIVTAAPREGA